jgi:cysteine synthase A
MSTAPARRSGAQTGGRVDGFVCAAGTGGTLAGTAEALRARNPQVRIALSDPEGSALYAHYTTGTLKAEGSSITEGIGQGRITRNLEGFTPDRAFRIPDREALDIVFGLMREEGLSLGGSSGINVAGAIRLARDLGPGHTIVTILCDGAARYALEAVQPGFPRRARPAGSGLARRAAGGPARLARLRPEPHPEFSSQKRGLALNGTECRSV